MSDFYNYNLCVTCNDKRDMGKPLKSEPFGDVVFTQTDPDHDNCECKECGQKVLFTVKMKVCDQSAAEYGRGM